MAYNDKKVVELRDMCSVRGLPSSGTKVVLIERLKLLERQQQQQKESLSLINKEEDEMQVDVTIPIIQQQQQQQPRASTPLQGSETEPSHEVNIKYEYEPTPDGLQAMNTEENPASESTLPQQVSEQQRNPSPNVDMPSGYQESINPVGQQQIEHLPASSSPPSTMTSPKMTRTDIPPPSTSSSLEQNQTQPFDTKQSSSTYQRDEPCEVVDRDLLARLISERKYGTQNVYGVSRGAMMNQGRANGITYNYDLLLEVVQGSLIYNDGEIPYWLKNAYDTTYGTTYSGESASVFCPGIPVEDLFLGFDFRR